ncbi:MAG: putative glycoside hydrolase [Candidatus Bipolaricaulota bacterium]|nr:putative glycoside hydrolase [Candidatus Bipolaricaulota bacterium]MCS7274918.1 putative glycoside hydrolase [Candidatus Bipolaricaulota bacterium]MDW8110285.1 putative glycoside hydrolase [Candidatus Bipolaricaulota bacterium]MDW8329958.1 putative glycoside hydrolase [Candidatus Bipolaricaulota bacterium]
MKTLFRPLKALLLLGIAAIVVLMVLGLGAAPPGPSAPAVAGPYIRGVYLPANVAAHPKRLQEITQKARRIGFNALVIDVKDNHGLVYYDTKVPLAAQIGARNPLLKLEELLPSLRSQGFYLIARQVLFYDPKVARHLDALKTEREPGRWVSPAEERVQRYNLAIAEEVAALGFDEIQFDYVRWPDGGAYRPIYAERYAAIERFLQRVHNRLYKKITLSADVFGRALWPWNLKKIDPIGQHLETFQRYLHVLSPMIYPSHYETEALRSDPYGTIKKALLSGQQRGLALRPFLQAFEMHIPATMTYDEYIRAQVRAAHELGVESYLFWNPRGDYTGLWRALSTR